MGKQKKKEQQGAEEEQAMQVDGAGKKTRKNPQLPENLEVQRTHVLVGPEMNAHTRTVTSANAYMPLGIDNAWDLDAFRKDFKIHVNKLTSELIEFDMIGADPAVANALRRILIAEVPTVAVEHVFVINNTSIIQDEVLAHRLGLVPIAVDPAALMFKTAEEAPSEQNTLVFKLDVTCRRRGDTIQNERVLTSQLEWLPGGSELHEETGCRFAQGQGHMFAQDPPKPVHHDILLAKLRPGQSIQLEAHCVKGIAKDHAKWSPVATAWYKLLPEVVLLKEPSAEIAELLMAKAPGLFTRSGPEGKLQAGNARDHLMHLEKVRALLDEPAVAECVQYRKRKDHFIFTIESVGSIAPEALFEQALTILHDKAHRLTTLC